MNTFVSPDFSPDLSKLKNLFQNKDVMIVLDRIHNAGFTLAELVAAIAEKRKIVATEVVEISAFADTVELRDSLFADTADPQLEELCSAQLIVSSLPQVARRALSRYIEGSLPSHVPTMIEWIKKENSVHTSPVNYAMNTMHKFIDDIDSQAPCDVFYTYVNLRLITDLFDLDKVQSLKIFVCKDLKGTDDSVTDLNDTLQALEIEAQVELVDQYDPNVHKTVYVDNFRGIGLSIRNKLSKGDVVSPVTQSSRMETLYDTIREIGDALVCNVEIVSSKLSLYHRFLRVELPEEETTESIASEEALEENANDENRSTGGDADFFSAVPVRTPKARSGSKATPKGDSTVRDSQASLSTTNKEKKFEPSVRTSANSFSTEFLDNQFVTFYNDSTEMIQTQIKAVVRSCMQTKPGLFLKPEASQVNIFLDILEKAEADGVLSAASNAGFYGTRQARTGYAVEEIFNYYWCILYHTVAPNVKDFVSMARCVAYCMQSSKIGATWRKEPSSGMFVAMVKPKLR